MARYKSQAKKIKLAKQSRRTRWAPFWVVLKARGVGKRVHPSRLTRVKHSWRRSKIGKKVKLKKKIKGGGKRKKI